MSKKRFNVPCLTYVAVELLYSTFYDMSDVAKTIQLVRIEKYIHMFSIWKKTIYK